MAEFGVVASSKRSARTITAALLTVALAAFVSVAAVRPAAGATALECRADRPVGVGDALIFRVREPEAGSTYQWSGYDGLSATGEVITWTYGSAGWKLATVSQVDSSGTVLATASCGMHVLPPPGGAASVAPVLWVPADVDPAPLLPQLDRVWRSIRAAYYQHYGRTFVLEPVQAVRSASTEQDICGGDCTDVGRASTLMNVAFNDANAVAPAVPFRRYQFVMSWGAGGWAGSWGWDIAKGGVGDWATATAAGVLVPNSEPNLPDWAAAVFGSYASGVDTMWHEANHGIGWDEDNSQFIDHPPTQWEQDVVAESPWLTEIPADTTPPSVSIITPVGGGTISGMTTVQVDANDSDGMDAVGLVVDGQLLSVATSVPYAFDLDTFGLSSDGHQLTAIAYDAAGNTAEQTVDVNVMNELGGACDTNPPVGQFYACMYTGTNFDTYLGTMVDGVDQLDTGATAWGPRHRWPTGSVFHGIGSQISGRWKGVVDLPEGNYLFHVLADDGVRLRVNGQLVLDEWRDQAERFTASASGLGGPTTIEVEWYQNFGGKALELWWQPTTVAPSVAEQPDSQSVPEGTAVSFTTAASGDPSPTVQWQSSTDGGRTFSDVPGATSPTLSLVAQLSDNGTRYRAVFTNVPAGQPRTTTLTEPATLTVTPPPLPLAPSSVTATPGVASATVSWAAPGETGGSPITSYTVTASPGGATAIVDGATRSTTVTGLTVGESYTFTVTATNAAGLTSDASGPSNAVTPVGGIDDDEASFTAAWQDGAETHIDLSQDVTLTCAGGEPTRDSTTAIVVYGHGHTLRQTCPTMRVLTQLGTGSVTVKNITVTGGDPIGPGGDGKSGGAIGSAGDVFVTNATLTGNRTDVGHGGAVSTPKNVVVSNSTVDDNQGGRGGAIDAGGDVSVSDSTMTDNHASSDGGAIRAIGNVTVANSTIADNTAIHDSGGGIMAGGSTSITDSTLSGNVAGDDGGAVLSFGPVLVVNSTISNNVRKDPPPFFGNGVAGITAGGLTLVYATIVDNTGGIGTLRPGNALTSFGSVVTSPDSRPACRLIPFVTSVSSGGYNLDNDGTCGFGAGPSDRSAFTSSLELGALDDNGGPTSTRLPAPTSPLLDQIPLTACDAGQAIIADQRGIIRPQGDGCDQGAVEAVVPTPARPPGVPQSVSATPGDGSATVSWSPPDDDGDSPITAYTVTASPNGATATVDGATLSTTVPGLTNGVSYTFTVTATNAAGLTSETSAPSNAVTPASRPKPPKHHHHHHHHGHGQHGGHHCQHDRGHARGEHASAAHRSCRPPAHSKLTNGRRR